KSVSTSQFISFATFSALLGSKIAFTLPPSRLLIIFASLAPKYPVPTIAYPIVFVIFYFFLLLYIIYFFLFLSFFFLFVCFRCIIYNFFLFNCPLFVSTCNFFMYQHKKYNCWNYH